MGNKIEIARVNWPAPLPDWIEVLANEVDNSSQAKVAAALSMSPATVSTVIANTYKADTKKVEQRVRDVFMNQPVKCPAFRKEIESALCLAWRLKLDNKRRPTDPMSVRMVRACRRCPQNPKNAEQNDV